MVQIGPTGEFPQGSLNENDEGEICLAIVANKKNKTVVIDFEKPVKWIGLDAMSARELAQIIINKSKELG